MQPTPTPPQSLSLSFSVWLHFLPCSCLHPFYICAHHQPDQRTVGLHTASHWDSNSLHGSVGCNSCLNEVYPGVSHRPARTASVEMTSLSAHLPPHPTSRAHEHSKGRRAGGPDSQDADPHPLCSMANAGQRPALSHKQGSRWHPGGGAAKSLCRGLMLGKAWDLGAF